MKNHLIPRAFAGAVAVTCLLAGAAAASPAKLLADTGFLAGPGKSYDTLASLSEGAKVDVIWCGTTENYCLVVIYNKKGWVPLALLNLRPGGGGDTADGGSSGGSGNSASVGGKAGGGSSGGNSNAGRSGPGGGGGNNFVKATGGEMAATEAALKP